MAEFVRPHYLPVIPRRGEVEVELQSRKIYWWWKRNIPELQHGRLKNLAACKMKTFLKLVVNPVSQFLFTFFLF